MILDARFKLTPLDTILIYCMPEGGRTGIIEIDVGVLAPFLGLLLLLEKPPWHSRTKTAMKSQLREGCLLLVCGKLRGVLTQGSSLCYLAVIEASGK